MKIKKSFITTELDGSQILIDTGTGFHGMIKNNKTAAFIVDCLKEDITLEQITEKMSEKYNAPIDILRADVIKTVNSLKAVGAIEE